MSSDHQQQRAKRYENIHHGLFVGETVFTAVLLLVFLLSGASCALADWAGRISGNPWLATAAFGVVLVVLTKLVFLPVNWFGGYYLEHRFELSNETLAGWLWDQVKSLGLGLVLGVVALDVVYFLLRVTGDWWWVAVGGFFLLFGVVVSALFPVLILPLFYKLTPLENESLRRRLTMLAQQVGAKVIGVYRMNLSEKTKKVNAAFAGLGATKRIILGDTLLDRFAEDEIEVVMAHEMAHYKHGDIAKMIGWGTMTTCVGLKVTATLLQTLLPQCGFARVSELGAFPLLALCLSGFSLLVLPVNNAFTRWREREADRVALELTGNRDGFIRAMRKLGEQNLADLAPNPVVEFLLYDHPSLARRIAWAEQWRHD
jgi:STE24 endopeptidase